MFEFRRGLLAAIAICSVALLNTPTLAATCPASTAGPYLAVTTNGGDTATCEQYADTGNINGNSDPFQTAHADYVYLDSTDPTASAGAADGALTIPTGDGTASGTWSIVASLVTGYYNFALGIKTGNHDPDWAVFYSEPIGRMAALGQ
jgi:hypothetical protein